MTRRIYIGCNCKAQIILKFIFKTKQKRIHRCVVHVLKYIRCALDCSLTSVQYFNVSVTPQLIHGTCVQPIFELVSSHTRLNISSVYSDAYIRHNVLMWKLANYTFQIVRKLFQSQNNS